MSGFCGSSHDDDDVGGGPCPVCDEHAGESKRCHKCDRCVHDDCMAEHQCSRWFGVWATREGYVGHWHMRRDDPGENLVTTRTEAERTCAALGEFAHERTDSLGWSYAVRPYPEDACHVCGLDRLEHFLPCRIEMPPVTPKESK